MKFRILAPVLAAALGVQTAFAGGYSEPMMESELVVEDTSSSAGGILVPILALILFAAAASGHGGGGGDAVAPSDVRLKSDITPVGTAANGLPLYTFRYVGGTTVYRGVMAQDVLAYRPDAVVTLPGGWLAVDYGKLGMDMTAVD